MNEDDLIRLAAMLLLGEEPRYWHHDEDFAAFMDKVLEPADGAKMG